jgi:hypothetical protein
MVTEYAVAVNSGLSKNTVRQQASQQASSKPAEPGRQR